MMTSDILPALGNGTYLGPAQVIEAAGERVHLQFPDQDVWAGMALAVRYQPVAGDILLVIGQDDSWYVIGVLKGSGTTTLMAPGHLRLMAPNGAIELVSSEAVRINAPAVDVLADRMLVVARTITEKFTTASRWVRGLFSLRAGDAQTIVESTHRVAAGRIEQRSRGEVRINGTKIHLG